MRSLTLYNYSISIRALLSHLGEDPERFDAQSLRQFVLRTVSGGGWQQRKRARRLFACSFAF